MIPAHNEEANLEPTLLELTATLDAERLRYEIIIVNDNSSDETLTVATRLARERGEIRVISRTALGGFGRAIRAGLAAMRGDLVVIVMADRSDDPRDVVRYYRKIAEGYDCLFGSRFRKGSRVTNYPRGKLIVNRIVNRVIQLLFWTQFNDLTNAFKAYGRHVIEECGPYSSSHFNITIEMSLTALVRRYQIAEIPISWFGRTWGASNLSVAAMGSRRSRTIRSTSYSARISSSTFRTGSRSRPSCWSSPGSSNPRAGCSCWGRICASRARPTGISSTTFCPSPTSPWSRPSPRRAFPRSC